MAAMSDQDEPGAWLVESLSTLGALTPLSENDYYALIAALQDDYSIRGLAELMHRLTGVNWGRTSNNVYGVLGGQYAVTPADVARMREAALATGWRPDY